MYRGEGPWLGRVFASAVVRKVGYVLVAVAFAALAGQCHAAQCVGVDSNGFIVADDTAVSSCTGFVLATAAEFTDLQGFWEPLSIEQGAAIGVAIFGAWAVAFGLRKIRRIIEEG